MVGMKLSEKTSSYRAKVSYSCHGISMQKIRMDLISYSESDEKRGFTDAGVSNQQYFEEIVASKN
jgi:hypothetical protein